MNNSKVCTKCKVLKNILNFCKHKRTKDGVNTWCKVCVKEYAANSKTRKNYMADYYKKNKERTAPNRLQHSANWYKNNKVKALEYSASYYNRNKNEIIKRNIEYSKNRKKVDIQFKLSLNLRHRLNSAIRYNKKVGSSIKDLGCTLFQLKQHLESLFQPGMTWENYGVHGWHIDHVIPLASFDLTDRDQLLKACHYTNLQPLWAQDNWKKKDKIL